MPTLPPPPLQDIQKLPYSIQEWLRQVRDIILGTAGPTVPFTSLDFTGSNLTSVQTRNHDTLQNIDGGAAGDYQHLTTAQAATVATLTSGTYTPTLTNVTNLGASTAYACQYMQIGSTVTVSGKVDIDPTAVGATQLGISLPIASNFATEQQCGGTAFAAAIAGQGAAIRGDATNNRAEMVWIAVDVTNQSMFFSFTYTII